MTAINGKKEIGLCVLHILERYSSPEHPLTAAQIEEKLRAEFSMDAGRNAISRNLSLLRELGYPIESCTENRNRGVYLKPLFSGTELRVLIDSVLLSRYIPRQEAKHLIRKLTEMGQAGFSNGTQDIVAVDKWNRTHNQAFFDLLDTLSRAVRLHVQVRFTYNHVGLDGELVSDGERTAHPLAVLCTQGQYYLLACYSDSREVRHFRIDHMTEIQMTDRSAVTPYDLPAFKNGVNMAQYAAQHTYMYSGDPVWVRLRMPVTAAGVVYDTFGLSAALTPLADGTMEVQVLCSPENMQFFAMQYASVCEVISPPKLRQSIQENIAHLAEKYGLRVAAEDKTEQKN